MQNDLVCPLWVISRHKRPILGMSALPPKADIQNGYVKRQDPEQKYVVHVRQAGQT
jgi:hypothetical protein